MLPSYLPSTQAQLVVSVAKPSDQGLERPAIKRGCQIEIFEDV
jgi:hypothetical protein